MPPQVPALKTSAGENGAEADHDPERDAVLRGRRVLIVDDDIRNVFALTSALEAHGLHVLYSDNGRSGIEKLESDENIALVLMDIMMPELDGNATTRAIRAMPQFAELPIISLTAKAMQGDRERSLEAGATDYVTKPVDLEHLLNVMRTWLDPDAPSVNGGAAQPDGGSDDAPSATDGDSVDSSGSPEQEQE